MRKIYRYVIFTVLAVWAVSFSISAQTGPSSSITGAFRTGDVSGIARHMDNMVDISINNSQSTSSRTQAEMVLRDFFSKNEPKGFESHQNGSNEQQKTAFSIGYLNTSNGRYRVYFLLKQQSGTYKIQEIRIEK